MRKTFLFLGLLLSLLAMNIGASSCEAARLSDILNSKDPYVIVVYTGWSNFPIVRSNVEKLNEKYPEITFSMVSLNNPESRALFEKGPMTFSGFPYIQMARGKVGSFVEPACAKDFACFDRKISRFFK